MIVHPVGWPRVGRPVCISDIENTLYSVLSGIDVQCLSLSGGLDSSLMLYYMKQIYGNSVQTFTIALNRRHPDYVWSRKMAGWFGVDWEPFVVGNRDLERLKGDYPGDEIVRAFYKWLEEEQGVQEIIACDGIDEYMCGYYAHQKEPTEATYYKFLGEMVENHLRPLHKNSGNVRVYLPYIDKRMVTLYGRIPLQKKYKSRKAVVVEIAKQHLPSGVLRRRKYGFCDAMKIKSR